jgi:hypothetical protein
MKNALVAHYIGIIQVQGKVLISYESDSFLAFLRTCVYLPLYGIFVVHRFLRYLFHIRIRNSRELEKSIPQSIVAHYSKRELYIASANLTILDLSKIAHIVPESMIAN